MIEYLGYYTYHTPIENRKKLINASHTYGMTLYGVREEAGEVRFRITLAEARHAEEVFTYIGLPIMRDPLGGLAGVCRRVAFHPGIWIGIVLSVLLYVWLSGMVWEVRVISRTDIDEDRVLQLLSECGLDEGRRISALDEDEIVADYLMLDTDIAFAAVHLRGVVAEVEVIPYEVKEPPQITGEPCNIVATEDALITDITVYAGRALVRVGETVRAGDILVSGVVTNVSGTQLVRASADIRGQRTGSFEIVAPLRVTSSSVISQKTAGMEIRIFGRSFVFGDIGTSEGQLTQVKQIYLFDRIRLPVRITRAYTCEYIKSEHSLTEEEQARRAEAMLEARMEEILGDGALLSMEKQESKDEEGYKISVQMVFESNIGKALAFDVKKQ